MHEIAENLQTFAIEYGNKANLL